MSASFLGVLHDMFTFSLVKFLKIYISFQIFFLVLFADIFCDAFKALLHDMYGPILLI